MGNLAAMLKESGHTVTGSDQALYPPMSERLKEWNIEAAPFDRSRIYGDGRPRADLYIVGNVISRGNVEVEEVLDRNLPLTSMSAALYDFFLKGRRVQVIAGTHGKTTTSFLLHHILDSAGRRPGLFAGGIRGDRHPGYSLPESELFVIEGDEYDTAFFDKGPKFLHYRPTDLILTHVEFDHADIYASYEAYKRSFELLLRWIPSNGNVAAFVSSSGVREVISSLPAGRLFWYGNKEEPLFQQPILAGHNHQSIVNAESYHYQRSSRSITLSDIGRADVDFIGGYNTANALAASIIAKQLGVNDDQILKALSTFQGVLRRQQIRRRVNLANSEVIFIEDFAHHPTAVKLTIEAARQAYPNHRLIALYEPRSATSHRNIFQYEYETAFDNADEAYLADVFNPAKVAERDRLDVPSIVATINAKAGRPKAHFAATTDSLVDTIGQLIKNTGSNQTQPMLILAMSNGSFGGIYPKIDRLIDDALSGT